MAWPLIAFLTLPPFMGAAALRSNREIGRIAAVAATIAVTAFAVYGQAAALNPHEESSLAPLGFFAGTVYGIAALAAIYGTERLVRAVHRHRRRAT
jgi:hypothetical protein